MHIPLEAQALYLLVTAVPLLQYLNGAAGPGLLMTAAWVLAATFGGCQLVSRFAARRRQLS